NILLDEQLERLLRNTKPQWQGWFNRLDFYTRRIPMPGLEMVLSRSGRPDPAGAIEYLKARRFIKVYADDPQPVTAIQSAAIFSEGLDVTRLYAFYAVLRDRLPLATIQEGWLKECLDCIPKDFKTLDVFEVHALAVEIYRILMQGTPGLPIVKVKIERS